MKDYHTNIQINAPIEKVWQALTNFSEYKNWNPLVSDITGDIQEGGMIKTSIVPLKNTFSARLLAFKENQEMTWQGKMIASFLLSGKHYYKLSKTDDNHTLLEHGEYFTGLFSVFIPKKMLKDMENTFIAHNEALKNVIENEG